MDGGYRTSRIDLNLCIGPTGDDRLEALSGYKVVTLTEMDGKGNHNAFRNWELRNNNRELWAEGELKPGIAGILPWNWWADSEWGWKSFQLDEHLDNIDGRLRFWAQKYEPPFPREVMNVLEIVNQVADEYERSQKSPLEQMLDDASEQMIENKLKELGWERKERKWMKKVRYDGDKLVRFGS
ncbi:hypothetical protein E8E11_002219 [Didymella keratinophila]|nr:hypothetical protein E8E11_002219 [Didymella keratinophila]